MTVVIQINLCRTLRVQLSVVDAQRVRQVQHNTQIAVNGGIGANGLPMQTAVSRFDLKSKGRRKGNLARFDFKRMQSDEKIVKVGGYVHTTAQIQLIAAGNG